MIPDGGWPLPGVSLGADYNPEQWPREVWAEDVRLMREAGVGFVTLGVFSWALLEPADGRFDFGWLDDVMDLLHDGGIRVDLATASASPPPWLSRSHPELLPVDRDGHRDWPGSRQAWCPSSPVFRQRSLRLVEAMAQRYAAHPALVMWHVSNELGGANARCYCDVSAAAFRGWLRRRYTDSLDRLNDSWSTAFWSQHYGDWDEVLPPRRTGAGPNPAHLLDFARFSSDEVLGQYVAERDVLHRLSPGVPVTTNVMVMTHVQNMDYWSWAPEQDLVSQDHYLDHRLEHPHAELAFCGDLTRGLAGGDPWWLMEHSTSAVNWQPVNYAKEPGALLRTSLGHVARGADAVGFFQWRQSRAGAETFHSALLPHAGTDTKVWRDVCELGAVLGRAGEVAGTHVAADVAVLFDWVAQWACDQPNHPTGAMHYADEPLALHRALRALGVTADVVRPGSDLAGYRLVAVPTLFLTDDRLADDLRRYVEGGGQLVVTYFSGIVDESCHVRLGGYPGAFRELLGIATEEFFPLEPGERRPLAVTGAWGTGGDTWTGSTWSELTHARGAEVVATWGDGPLAGHPVITRHAVGDGAAWFVGTALDDAARGRLLARICRDAGVQPVVADLPADVEAVRRTGEARSFLFLINHGPESATIAVTGDDLVTQTSATGALVLPAGGCAVVREG